MITNDKVQFAKKSKLVSVLFLRKMTQFVRIRSMSDMRKIRKSALLKQSATGTAGIWLT
jgi:hypothetical protein